MPNAHSPLPYLVRPWRLFAVVLVSVFVIEALVMLVLPWVLPASSGYLVQAILDSLMLTAILAPLLWRFIIHPLESLLELRTKLLRRILTVQEDERGRIARDLHDGLGQSLTCLLVGLRTAQELSNDSGVREHLEELRRVGGTLHDELRRLSQGLRPAVLDDVGLAAALEQLCRDAQTSSGREVSTTIHDRRQRRLPPLVETNCFRIVQEAIANALRHSRSGPIKVFMQLTPEAVSLVVCNGADAPLDVAPMDESSGEFRFESLSLTRTPAAQETFRIWTIRERVGLLDGSVEVESREDGSTCVTCRIPVAEMGKS
ncbi:MAG: histidine kinase [Pirellulales bacterium]